MNNNHLDMQNISVIEIPIILYYLELDYGYRQISIPGFSA